MRTLRVVTLLLQIATLLLMGLVLVRLAHAEPPSIYADDGTYLGNLNSNKYDPNSVSNEYGRYGDPYSPDSINNPYGKYGDPYSPDSVTNPYATSSGFMGDSER